jgi:ABC-2 type transport system ATP-binding protein
MDAQAEDWYTSHGCELSPTRTFMKVIAVRNLCKNFRSIQALKEVNLAVEEGQIYGVLGQNGAGKTTMIKILLGIIRHWQGEAELLGEPAGTARVRARVGYLPEDHRFPEYHTAYSLLDFYGQLLGVARATRSRRIPEMLELVGLKGRMYYKIRTYSKGMKQRVGIAQALFHDPDVIFLDEPTDGVDPVGRRDIRQILLQLKERGKTIFINSHLLGEIEQLCDRVSIIHKGQLVREGDIQSLTQQHGLFLIGLAPGQQFPTDDVRNLGGYECSLQGEYWEVQLRGAQTIDPVVDLLRGRGLSIRHLTEKRQSLEDLFLKTVGGDSDPTAPSKRRGKLDSDEPPVVTVVGTEQLKRKSHS